MATIYLAQLSAARTLAHDHVRTMTMQPQHGIKNISCFAPTQAMVWGHKKHAHPEDSRCTGTWKDAVPVTNEQYTEQYLALIEKNMSDGMIWLANLPEDGVILLCCYCKQGEFCHRRILFPVLQEWISMLGLKHSVVLR
jgi:hypothetical protein